MTCPELSWPSEIKFLSRLDGHVSILSEIAVVRSEQCWLEATFRPGSFAP
jgi:hypothetical protein